VRSLWKNQPSFLLCSLRKVEQWFLFQTLPEWPYRVSFGSLYNWIPKLRKHTKQAFFVKRGWLGAFIEKNWTASFLFQKLPKWPSQASFAPLYYRNLSFGSNGVDWVHSLQNIQLSFLFQKWRERPSRVSFAPLYRLSDPGPRDCAHRIDARKVPDTHKGGRNWTQTRTPL